MMHLTQHTEKDSLCILTIQKKLLSEHGHLLDIL